MFRNLYRNFVVTGADRFNFGDSANILQVIADLFGQLFLVALAHIAEHTNPDHLTLRSDAINVWVFNLLREVRNSIHKHLHFIHDHLRVIAVFHLDGDRATTLAGSRSQAFDAVDVFQSILDEDDDALFDFLWCSTREWHLNANSVEFDFGKHLLTNFKHHENTGDDDQCHQQVRRNGVVSPPGNQSLFAASFWRVLWYLHY